MQDFFNWQGVVGTIFGLLGLYFSWNAWKESKMTQQILENERLRLNEKVSIILTDGFFSKNLPVIRRQEVRRSEVQGRIRLVPTKNNSSYSIAYLNSEDFFKQIDLIVEGSNEKGDTKIEIKCTTPELSQFTFYQELIAAERNTKKVQKRNGK